MESKARYVIATVVRRLVVIALLGVTLCGLLTPQAAPAAGLTPSTVLGWEPGVGDGVPPAGPLTVYFNRPMDRLSVQRAWSLTPTASGVFRWSGTSVTFVPSHPLRAVTRYRLTIGAAALSLTAGASLLPFTARFRTADALHVVSVSPGRRTTGVPVYGRILVSFNHPMVSLASAGTSRNPSHWSVTISPRPAGHGSWLGTSTWVFHPDGQLAPSTRYTITVGRGVQDSSGEHLGRGLRWSFRTATPSIFSRSPHNDAEYVDPRTAIAVTFNQAMDHPSTARAFSLRSRGASVSGSLSWQGTRLVFTPSTMLMAGQPYTVRIGASALARNRLASLGSVTTWQFSVAPLPRINSSEPGENGTVYAMPLYGYRGYGFGGGPLCCSPYSVRVNFNTPMDRAVLDHHLTVSPSIGHLQTGFGAVDSSQYAYSIGGDFQPSTRYTVTLASPLRDAFGRPLSIGLTWHFTTSRRYPSVSLFGMSGREGISFSAGQIIRAPVQYVNLPRVRYTLIRTNLYDLATAQNAPPAGTVVRHWTETVPNERDRVQNKGVALTQGDGSALPPGLYWLDAQATGEIPGWPALDYPPESSEIVAVTNVSLTVKSTGSETLVWANSAQSGEPLADRTIRITDYLGRTLAQGKTNGQGIHSFHTVPNGRAFAATIGDGPYYGLAKQWWQPSTDSPSYLTNLPWSNGNPTGNGTYLYTDRPVYRPGQIVHFRGLLWQDRDAVYRAMSTGGVHLQAMDSTGKELYQRWTALDRFGTVNGSFRLPAGTPTGDGRIFVNVAGSRGVNAAFTVAEYRKPEFLAALTSPRASYVQGQTLRVGVRVRYVFGTPVVRQPVSWTAYAQPRFPQPPGWEGYNFFDWEGYWQANIDGSTTGGQNTTQFGRQIGTGTGKTDAEGGLSIALPIDLKGELIDQTITVEATATDANHQAVSGRIVLPAYRSGVAIGLNVEHATLPVGQAQTVEIAAVSPDGMALAGRSLAATISRRTYSSQLVDLGNHQTGWKSVPHDTPVATRMLTSNASGKAVVTFTPTTGGEYYIRVQAGDGLGNTAHNALSVYASAAGFSDWGPTNDTNLRLKTDKSTYSVGQTAHLVVPAPFDHAVALVTVERGTIRRQYVTHFATNSPVVNVHIGLDDVPNVFVTVTLYRGWRGGSPPDWRYGAAELHVRVDPRHLIVHLRQNGYRHHPRDGVTYTVTTTDVRGRPVSAQLSLALVDTAVLALHDEVNPDILQAFYSERPLGVSTSSDGTLSVDHAQLQPPFVVTGNSVANTTAQAGVAQPVPRTGGGGGGPPQPITVRSNFADTAWWLGGLVTGPGGRGVLHLVLPDNATTWRLDARGVTADTSVRSAQLRTLASQDLILRPTLPRFLIQGDHLRVGAVLNNTLARPVTARISIAGKGIGLPAGASSTVRVPPHGERSVLWQANVPVSSTATVLLRAVPLIPGAHGDAVKMAIPVHRPLTDETTATSGQVYAGISQMVIVPRRAVTVPGALTVKLSASLTAGLGDAWGQFKPQVDESNDDTANRVLVAAALHSLPANITGLSASTHRHLPQTIAAGVQRLLDKQWYDGGWPWFTAPYVYQSDPTITADVLQALSASGEHGHLVNQSMARARGYLHNQLTLVSAADRTHLLLVLAQSGGNSRPDAEALWSDSIRRLHLDAAPLADLGVALALQGDRARGRSVVADLAGRAKASATGAHWESAGMQYGGTPAIASTTEVLSALLRLSPGDPTVPAAVRWLMLARQGDGWDCPHDSAQAITALAAYARAAREGTAQYSYRVAVNGASRLAGRYDAARQRGTSVLRIPLAGLRRAGSNSMSITRGATDGSFGLGPLYYLARLHYYLPAEAIAQRSEGVTVSRQYLTLSGRKVSVVRAGQALRVQLTVRTDQTLLYLNLQDPLPAGCEPIDESLNTSQRGLFGQPPLQPYGAVVDLSWYLMHTDLHDNRTSLYAYALPPGTYRYTYLVQATVSGRYEVAPTHVSETFFPEVFGRSRGQVLVVQ